MRYPYRAELGGSAQAGYYLLTGLMPLVAYRLFEALTGPKREPWLVKMVGLLTVAVGWTIARDPGGRERTTRFLAPAAAGAYAVIDVWYAGVRRRIAPIYLLDALVEVLFVIGWRVLPVRTSPASDGSTDP